MSEPLKARETEADRRCSFCDGVIFKGQRFFVPDFFPVHFSHICETCVRRFESYLEASDQWRQDWQARKAALGL